MRVDRSLYSAGRQPCANFDPHEESNGYMAWDNVHCCIHCHDATGGTVSFCESCKRDHHINGYQTCTLGLASKGEMKDTQ